MWYNKITANLGDIPDFISYYEKELDAARKTIAIRGNISQQIAELPGNTERFFTSLQEIEAVLNYLNIQLRKIKHETLL